MLTQHWQSEAISHQGCVRSENQDAYLSDGNNQLWLVADGMGGGEAGALASQMLKQAFENVRLKASLVERVEQLEQLVLSANLNIYHYARENFSGAYMGTTLVLLNRWRNLGILLWAGDSRCYGQDARELFCLTWDHNQATELMKSGLLSEDEMKKMPKSNAITRAVGLDVELCMEIKLVDMTAWQLFLLCSDGIYGEVSESLMFNCFSTGSSISDKLDDIQKKVLKSGAHDNLTLICVYPDRQCETEISTAYLHPWNKDIEQLQFDYYLGNISQLELLGKRGKLLDNLVEILPESEDATETLKSGEVKALYQLSEQNRHKRDPVYFIFAGIIVLILLIFIYIFTGGSGKV
ncbi:PP2C family protein-serine/threonine phosphatase [Thalassomonas haliotis]|uniref:Serine/threonine-protein phosphatase n=1 Tax=Thalassomonas haliotis TaxID=485448 RepID=A0ABY7V740_9GAMM|nr:protein phosphatase 2C domain-containing protein [Thalassomonas haliotis]WDE09499.1 serine/threonine-protein phosphatase [Thalassomonas haliotis]